MSKKKRVWYPGAMYHIMSRGNRKKELFKNKIDYEYYLYILRQVKEDYPFSLSSYCLMRNHVHLQIKTRGIEIWKIMRQINLFYAKYFNKKYNLVGHVFQGRYKSKLIQDISYDIGLSRYIHLNPVEAEIVARPEQYYWSSYNIYLGKKKDGLIDTSNILSYFKVKDPRQRYKKYCEAVIGKEGKNIFEKW
ncbi:MAG: transposase [Halanaerobium sp.]